MNTLWKQPARLCRRREPLSAPAEKAPSTQLAAGSLEDMVRRAIARVAEAGDPEREALFIDFGADRVLAWSEIRTLRRSPEFPVEI